jgi:dipeptidyl aminopeptidase/acylaminoacyl peptidase
MFMHWTEPLTAVFVFAFSCVVAAADEPHPFTVSDLVAMDRISDPQVSPDGQSVVFELYQTDMEANKGRTQIWMVKTGGAGFRKLTGHPKGATAPQWSPDGKWIYYLSARTEVSQVWKTGADGGEEEQVTQLPLDAGNLLVSPDGKRLAFSMDVFPGASPAETKAKLDEAEKRKSSGRIFEGGFVRHWDAWSDGRRSHIFVLNLVDQNVTDVMKGMDCDTPSKPFGGTEEFAFTPDGLGIVFTAKNAGRKESWSTNFDLFYTPVDGSKDPINLTPDNPAWDTQPAFSPDGKTLAYLSMKRPGYENDRYRMMLKPWPSGPVRVLAETWDRSPQSIFWSPDGKLIYALADHIGQHSLFAVDVKTGHVRTVIRDGYVRSLGFSGKHLIFGMDHLRSPVELYVSDKDGKSIRQLTRINADKLAKVKLGEPEQFSFKGWNDETVYGYIVKPADFDPAKKYPIAFLIHGGPQQSFSNDFHYRWNPQTYAGAGYAAVMVDFHGSTGYGQAFTDAINGNWGERPLVDLERGLEYVIKQYPWLDSSRIAALGASYGGYMVNWIAGNWADRFCCLVCHDGNLDERFAYFDTEELWFPEWEHGGTPWENPAGYEKENPLNFIKYWKTPMLVIHGEKDYRIPYTHGLAAFNALQRKGIPSKLLLFPDENHWVLKPHNSILWHETVIGWLDRWCK